MFLLKTDTHDLKKRVIAIFFMLILLFSISLQLFHHHHHCDADSTTNKEAGISIAKHFTHCIACDQINHHHSFLVYSLSTEIEEPALSFLFIQGEHYCEGFWKFELQGITNKAPPFAITVA